MTHQVTIRTVLRTGYGGWRPLWDGYNASGFIVYAHELCTNPNPLDLKAK